MTPPRAEPFADVDAIVVGASAGGVEALLTLLPRLPAKTKASILIVLHLPRHHPSSLPEIFGPRCALPVREAEDKAPVEPGVVYVAPPDYHLLVDRDSDGAPSLALSSDELVNYSRPAIDVLFESAADFYESRVAGIILTGANADGAAGLAAVHRAGGFTVVQQPSTAIASAMPVAALGRGPVDLVLPLAGIADLFGTLPLVDD
jgi:two-component system chemotaxis response regulator CheB